MIFHSPKIQKIAIRIYTLWKLKIIDMSHPIQKETLWDRSKDTNT